MEKATVKGGFLFCPYLPSQEQETDAPAPATTPEAEIVLFPYLEAL